MAEAPPEMMPTLDGVAEAAPRVTQLAIPGFGPDRVREMKQLTELSQDPLVRAYLRRLAARGAAPKGVAAYRYQLRSILRAAARLTGRPVGMPALFADVALLGSALVDEISWTSDRQLSKWTLAQRRSAIRSFADLMGPELTSLVGENPHVTLDLALRRVAVRVGGGYRLHGGAPRRRGGQAPTAGEVNQVIVEAGHAPGFAGARNRAFFGILAATGARVNALRQLDGADCVVLPSGRVRLFLHEKGKVEHREVELGSEQAEALRAYAEAFNRHASRQGWRARVQLGEPGPVWRNSGRGQWPYPDLLTALRAACVAAGVPTFTPHALRRAFATDAASELPRHVVALAGGWQGVDRLDDHYVRPRTSTIWEKIRRVEDRGDDRIGTPTEAASAVS